MERYRTHGSFCTQSTVFISSNSAFTLCNFSCLIIKHLEKISYLCSLCNQLREAGPAEHCLPEERNLKSMERIAFGVASHPPLATESWLRLGVCLLCGQNQANSLGQLLLTVLWGHPREAPVLPEVLCRGTWARTSNDVFTPPRHR